MTDLSQRISRYETPLRIHLIGVAGSGMSGLALLLLGMGHRVSGSDKVSTAETERMQGIGLDFSTPHTAAAPRRMSRSHPPHEKRRSCIRHPRKNHDSIPGRPHPARIGHAS